MPTLARRIAAIAAALLGALPALADESAPVPPEDALVPPRVVERAEPVWPEEARAEGLSGTVVLQLVIDAEGRVTEARIVQGAGHGFDESALEAVRRTRYAPATRRGEPIAVQVNEELRFEPALPMLHDRAVPPASPEPSARPGFEATVRGERPFTAASAMTVRDRDFLLRPRNSPEDILRAVPGLVLAQHQGGGKADQLFLRGFDADHGTDVAVSLDGIPVNLVSHAHGQGYADLHFLIPEVIERLELSKGPYFADKGDFDTAGAVNLVTRDAFEKSQVSLSGGSFDTVRFLGIASPTSGTLRSFFAAEAFATQGPFLHPENLERFNLFAKTSWDPTPGTRVSLLGTAYGSGWNGSGQIPARLVDGGFLDRFGAIDPTEGGITQRQQAILSVTSRPNDRSQLTAAVSALRYGLALFDDFTFQARDPAHGDAIEQDDDRTSLFATLRYDRKDRPPLLPGTLESTFGASYRSDAVTASLWRVENRARLPGCGAAANPCVNTFDRQANAATFVQEDWRPDRRVRLVAGLRYDLFDFEVHSLSPDGRLDPESPAPVSPVVQRSILSPKVSAVISPRDDLDLYLNFGTGFHSNDARSAVESGGSGVLPRAVGYEAGARTRLFGDRVDLALALWRLDLASELVWSGDDGGTAPSGPSRREGIDFEGRWSVLPWLFADLDVLVARSRFLTDDGSGTAVPLAPPLIVTGGLTARHPSGVHASLRLRHLADRPATGFTAANGVPACTPAMDASDPALRCRLVAEGYTVLDLQLEYVREKWSVGLVAQNLTNANYREAQFANDSQVIAPPDGHAISASGASWVPETHPVRDLHFTPGNPLGVVLTATLFL